MADMNPDSIPTKLPTVPVSVLKRRRRRQAQVAHRAQLSVKTRNKQYKTKRHTFKRAEQFVKDFRLKERDAIRIKREAKLRGNHYTNDDTSLGLVIKIKSTKLAAQNVHKILHLMRLRRVNTGVFIKLNKATVNMLRICEPYVTWGNPNLKSVRDLIFKRGFAKIDKKPVPITSNKIIEDKLGSVGIICTEDLIHQIFTTGDNFKKASNFLWPFKLNTPNGGWTKIINPFLKGGEYGNRGDKINDLVKRML